MGLITYDDKDKTLPVGVPRHQVRDVDMNELKDTINANWEAFLAAVGDDLDFAQSIADALALKANINSPTFTGTVGGITKAMVGLGNAENTSDFDKIISNLTQIALNAKMARTDYAVGIDVVGTKNGSNVVFTIAQTIVSGTAEVFVNGQRKSEGLGYTIAYPAGVATITFVVAPESDEDIKVNYIRP